jgi:hypothetical protein
MKKSGLADSPFFSAPFQESPAGDGNRTTERKTERSNARTDSRTEKRTDTLPTKRRTKRYSFEFFEDQLLHLKRVKYQAELRGNVLSLSDIVRQALDTYLSDK